MSLHRKFLMFVNSIPLALFIYLLCIFLFGIVLAFLLPRLLQLAIQCNTTFVPVSCYFHIKSGVFYSQAYTFNTEEFKLHCVFLEAAQCKSFHLRGSNKLENCSKKKWKGGRMQFSEGKKQEFISRQEESAVHTEAGGKQLWKGFGNRRSPAWHKFCCEGKTVFFLGVTKVLEWPLCFSQH